MSGPFGEAELACLHGRPQTRSHRNRRSGRNTPRRPSRLATQIAEPDTFDVAGRDVEMDEEVP
jgi:hypothetical protein